MILLDHLAAVIPMLGILIFVHELGHFLVAKACGVRVLKFSLGFGPPLGFGRLRMRWERAGTEYVIAWFPLGGFVKMLGENLELQGQDDPDAVDDARPEEYLNAKPTWQKLSIIFAGPAMNLVLPVLAFVAVLAVGIPRLAAVVGTVEISSPAARAGLRPGDRILSVDGRPVSWWKEVDTAIRQSGASELALRVSRGSGVVELSVPVESRMGLDEFESVERVGWIGVQSMRLPALLGVPEDTAPAAAAGLRSGDRVQAVAGQAVEDWESFRAAYESATGESVDFAVRRGDEESTQPFSVPVLGSLQRLGVVPATVLIESVDKALPAWAAGMRAGDLILAVDDRPVGTFATFQETVRASQGRPLRITYARGGETTSVSMTPQRSSVEGLMGEEERYLIGIRYDPALLPGVVEIVQERNPLRALPEALEMTGDAIGHILTGIGKLVTGQVGTDKLAGPIGIAQIARRSLDLGWTEYLYTMILISINLGLLNLLPIPILDGGQALLFAVEGIKRAPISMRTRELVQQLGLTMILMLMGLAFWNDISRNWSKFVEWLSGAGA